MAKKCLLFSALLLPALFACQEFFNFKSLPKSEVNHQLIVVAKTISGIKAKGYEKALPPNTAIHFEVGSNHIKQNANADGSFIFEMPLDNAMATFGKFTFRFDKKIIQQVYELKDLNSALQSIAQPAFSLSSDFNHITTTKTHALLLSSAAAQINKIELNKEWTLNDNKKETILLNPNPKVALLPRSVSAKNNHALVTLMGSHELALIDLSQGRILEKTKLKDLSGSLFLFDLLPSLSVKNPFSADDGSNVSSIIKRSFAHSPEQVFAIDDETFLVTFVNFYQMADKSAQTNAVMGPGIVALLKIENNAIKTSDIIMLPFKNPLFITPHEGTHNLWITCSGVYQDLDNSLSSTNAGLVLLNLSHDKKSMSIKSEIALKGFVPAEPALVKDKLLVPEAYGSKVAIITETSTAIKYITLPAQNALFVFAKYWRDDVIFLGDVKGQLIAFSLSEGFFPFPFLAPIKLDQSQDKSIAFSPINLLLRAENFSAENTYEPGFSGWVLSSLQNKIVPLDFLKVFGP